MPINQFISVNNVYQAARFRSEKPELPRHYQRLLQKRGTSYALQNICATWLDPAFHRSQLSTEKLARLFDFTRLPRAELRHLVLDRIAQLNPTGQSVDFAKIATQQPTVFLFGEPAGSKRAFTKKLRTLGFHIVRELTAVTNYIFVGHRPPHPPPVLYDHFLNYQYFNENELETYFAAAHPAPLQAVTINADLLENLATLLYSNDPASEAVALSIMKTNGLPQSLIPVAVIAAKMSMDRKLRAQFRRFLKGKITTEAQILLSFPVYFRKQDPFEKLYTRLPNFDFGEYYYAAFKRTNYVYPDLLKSKQLSAPQRAELVAEYTESYLKNGKSLRVKHHLTTTEIEDLLAQPIFKDKLERLTILSDNLTALPRNLTAHLTIKHLEVRLPQTILEIPVAIFELYKLKTLQLYAPSVRQLPKEIAQLKRIKKLVINSRQARVAFPLEEIAELKMLRELRACLGSEVRAWLSQKCPKLKLGR